MFINFPKHKLKRNVGLLTLCVIGIDGTIGGGIFVLLAGGAEVAGMYLPLSFLLGGILAFMGALLYAEIGTTIPRSGADIALVFNTTRHRYYPFIFSWLVLLGDVSYLVINSLGMAFYANFFIGVNPLLIALLALTGAVLINLRGALSTGKSEVFTVSALLALLTLYVLVVVLDPGFHFETGELVAALPLNIIPIIAGTSLIFTTYIGFEYIASIAEEVEDPAKNIPKALMITIASTTLIFTVVSWVAVNAIDVNELAAAEAPFLLIAEQLGTIGWLIILPAAMIATIGSLLASTLVASRRLYALSQQGYLRALFSKVNRRQVPYRAVLAVATLAALMLLSNSVVLVAYIGNTVYLLGLIMIAVSLLRFRRQRPYLARPFRAPFFPYLPLFIIALASVILTLVGLTALVVTATWALIGYFVYLSTRIDRSKLTPMAVGGLGFLLLLVAISGIYLL